MWVGVKKRNKCQDEVVNVRGRCKTNKCDTTMDATWATSNCCTSMVQPVLNSGCPEAAVPCTLYCTCIRYGSDAPTIRKKQSPNSSWWNHKQQQVNNAQTHKEWEGDSDRARSWWERKDEKEVWGRKWWMWRLQKNECDTAMDANWVTSNCWTSMVQTVLYSGCTETTVAAAWNVYMHTIRYK